MGWFIANANLTEYTTATQTSFNNATTGLTTIDWRLISSPLNYAPGSSYMPPGSDVTFTATGGAGEDLTITELAGMVAQIVEYRGAIRFDPSKPDGTPRKLLDSGI